MRSEVFQQIEIDAPIETVFGLLSTPAGLLEWIAVDAVVEAKPGGIIQWVHENGDTVRGEVVEIDPPHRLTFTYGWVGNATVGPGSTVVDIQLEQVGRGPSTRLTLTHRGLSGEDAASHQAGWTYFLDVLAGLSGSRAGR